MGDGAKPDRRPILVTGSHRSGTTWVGRMLALSPQVGYVHEPFNLHHSQGICRARFEHWYTYLCERNAGPYEAALADTLAFRFGWGAALSGMRSLLSLPRIWREGRATGRLRAARCRPLMKDPIALFSAEWLARRFDMRVIVMIRHPAAFVGSLKKAGWSHRFSDFTAQPLLMERLPAPLGDQIRTHAASPQPIVDQACLLWNLIHHVIGTYRASHPNWRFIRHEDLSREPEDGYRELFAWLDLPFGDDIRDAIGKFAGGDNPVETEGLHTIRRDSRENILSWKRRLTDAEIARVRDQTGELAATFYGDGDW